MRLMKLALAALFAVLAFSAMVASSASAFHPLFVTLSAKELLFSGLGVDPILRGERGGFVATVLCEKVLAHGFVLHLSTLLHLLLLHFEGKCVQKIGGGANETCKEPILTKLLLGELGLLTSAKLLVVLLLRPSTGTEFAAIECGTGEATHVGGVIIGEIPENFKGNALEKQINTERSEIEIVFATINKSQHQSITEIFLLGVQMGPGEELSISGFLGGPASEEATATLKGDGKLEISTTKV
jgi:hypothetical protein